MTKEAKRKETISADNPEFALLVLVEERLNRARYLWKGRDRTYPVDEMTDEHLENTISMLHRIIEKRDAILENQEEP